MERPCSNQGQSCFDEGRKMIASSSYGASLSKEHNFLIPGGGGGQVNHETW